MDGYLQSEKLSFEKSMIDKYLYMQNLYDTQKGIDKEIESIALEMDNLPKLPKSMESWINSFSNNFKLSDFDKTFSLNKKYKKLIEERKSNSSKIKLFAIDNIIDQIEQVEK